MSVIAAALRELIAAGVTGDALVTAIERIEADQKPKRSSGAIRQQRYRERRKASLVTSQASRNVTSVTCDAPPPSMVSPITPSLTPPSNRKTRKKPYTPISENWWPSEADEAFALSEGWTPQKFKLEAHRFIDHAKANDRRQANWSAAWRNWVTSPYQHKGNGNGTGTNTLQGAFAELLNRTTGDDVEGTPSMVDITPRGNQTG